MGFYVALNVHETRPRCIDHAADVHQLAGLMVYGIIWPDVRSYYKILYAYNMQSHQIRSTQKLTDRQLKFVHQTECTYRPIRVYVRVCQVWNVLYTLDV